MEMVEVDLARLRAHPGNSNVMPEPLLAKLADHIGRSDRYPPVIVRPWRGEAGECSGTYQILDGHHRVEALRRLGRAAARCVVWEVDDEEALLLLATLNRLQGQDDPRKRGRLIGELAKRSELKALAGRLPERLEQLQKLLALEHAAPAPRPARAVEAMPQAVVFFLLPGDRRELERGLKALGGSREEALMAMVRLGGEMKPQMNTYEHGSEK